MSATPVALATKDAASGQLNSSISAATTSIPLKSGNGANFPQSYNGTATSVGTATALNSTGISAAIGGSAQVGKIIWNKTDGSIAVITAVAANALTTTRLLGGTTNLWNNSDVWVIDPFVATFAVVSTSAYGVQSITTSEEALIIGRSTDTLTVATAGRGYNGTVASSFAGDDYVYLFVTSPFPERLKDVISVIAQQQDTDRTTLSTANTNITNLQTGAYHYVVTTGSANAYVAATPALAAYAAGNLVVFNANFTNTGSATLNLNSLGAKTIKKNDGATNLAANDIISGQLVVVRYDGTNFQMLSPPGTPATAQVYEKAVFLGYTSSATIGTSSTSQAQFGTNTYTIPANDLINGVGYRFKAGGSFTRAAGNLDLYVVLGGSNFLTQGTAPGGNRDWLIEGEILGTAAAGASVAVRGLAEFNFENSVENRPDYNSATFATNGTLALQLGAKFDSSNAGNGITCDFLIVEKFSTSLF